MNNKKMLVFLGVVLIVIQLLSYSGMSKMYVGLYPDFDDLLYPTYVKDSELNAEKAMFAVSAGFDRFVSGFEDITYGDDEYRVMTATQITSAMVRESLNCRSGGSFGLTIYDTILTISYWCVGIIGAILLFVSTKVKE